MYCHICGAEAVDRCYSCGELFCPEHGKTRHGKTDCVRCSTGIRAGDRRADRISAAPLMKNARPGWWRPQEAEDYTPPECYACGGLARSRCYNCHDLFCPEHAGASDLCLGCEKSARSGMFVLGGIVLFFLVLNGIAFLQRLQP